MIFILFKTKYLVLKVHAELMHILSEIIANIYCIFCIHLCTNIILILYRHIIHVVYMFKKMYSFNIFIIKMGNKIASIFIFINLKFLDILFLVSQNSN